MKKICMLLASSGLTLSIVGCNEGNTPQTTQTKNSLQKSDVSKALLAKRAYFTSDENYDKAFKQKFGSENSPLDGMVPGTGWSTDAEHIAPNICFNTSQVIRDGATSTLRSEYLLDQSKLTDFLNLSSTINGGWGSFGINATMNYIKETNSNNLSASYNFVEKISRKVNVKYPLSVSKLLNTDGQDAYDGGDNPKFRLFCGDRLISSYSEGAFIIANIQVQLADKFQKQQFDAHIGANFGGFSELSAKISSIKTQYNLHGKIIISAFQLGGDPTQLSKVMPTTMSCSFDDMAACDKLYNTGLSDYLKNSLPNQFTKDSAFTPIGDVQLSPMLLDDDYNMELAPTYVTEDVKIARNQLLTYESQNQANYQALSAVFNNYPVPLDAGFKSQVQNAVNIAYGNIVKLQNSTDCWSAPNRCIKTRDNIKSSLLEQPNKNLISGFNDKQFSISSNWRNGGFNAVFYPTSNIHLWVLNSNKVDTSRFYYPLSGNGNGFAFNGIAHDRNGTKDGEYMIYLENTKWYVRWHYYCCGYDRYEYYPANVDVEKSYADLYNKVLN
ncbi:MAG: hypothetical protein PHC75_02265 [Burkholderiales bacterium]|nr:hypothetical protein [Burkholderiales bacterium]